MSDDERTFIAGITEILPSHWVLLSPVRLPDGWWSFTARPRVTRSSDQWIEVSAAGETREIALARLFADLSQKFPG